jgi:hypothetical protein
MREEFQKPSDKSADASRKDSIVAAFERQYPWFSREEIVEAMERFGNHRERAMAFLDMKSGSWAMIDLTEG